MRNMTTKESQGIALVTMLSGACCTTAGAAFFTLDLSAWMAAVNPQYYIDFGGSNPPIPNPMVPIPPNYFASEGIHLGASFQPLFGPQQFSLGSTIGGPPWPPRTVLQANFQGMSMMFNVPVMAIGVVAATGNVFPISVRYADGSFEHLYPSNLPYGWTFVGVTSTIPIVGFSHAGYYVDQMWLSNPVPAPSALGLLGLAGFVTRRRRGA